MARNHYKITFRDSVVVYVLVGVVHDLGNSVPFKVMSKEQMKIMNLTLFDIEEATFSCTEEEFLKNLTPEHLSGLKKARKNEFKLRARYEQ